MAKYRNEKGLFLNMLMYKCIHGTAPTRLCNEIEMYFDRHGLNTRNANSLNVVLPKPNIEKKLSDIPALKNGTPFITTCKIHKLYPLSKDYIKSSFSN